MKLKEDRRLLGITVRQLMAVNRKHPRPDRSEDDELTILEEARRNRFENIIFFKQQSFSGRIKKIYQND